MAGNPGKLISSLKRLSLFANKTTNPIGVEYQNKSLTITAQDLVFNNETPRQTSCVLEGEAINLGFGC
ncbi:MAG: hypothetical protein IPG21_11110 [Saprospiraceae bacterium]|nr:hypothetical protein [Candidatus Vicinibacter affinis]